MGRVKKHKLKRAQVMTAAVSKRWLDSSAVVAGKPSPEALGKEKAASYKPRPVPQTVQYDIK